MSMLMALATDSAWLLAAPDPSQGGSEPPGWGKLMTLGHWVFLVATLAAVVGFLVTGASLALTYRRGEGMASTPAASAPSASGASSSARPPRSSRC